MKIKARAININYKNVINNITLKGYMEYRNEIWKYAIDNNLEEIKNMNINIH